MRFEIAFAAVLAAENLSSASAVAHEASNGNEIQERARLREEAIKALSDRFPTDHRSLQERKKERPGRNLIGDKLRNISGHGARRLQSAVRKEHQKHQRQLAKKDNSSSGSDSIDLGILKPKRTKENIKKQLLTNVKKLELMKETSSNHSPESNNVALDLGILPSVSAKQKKNVFTSDIKKLVEAANENVGAGGSSGDLSTSNSLLNSGTIPSRTKESGIGNDDRRLEELVDLQENLEAPLAFMVDSLCEGVGPFCDICQVDFVDENNKPAGYDVAMKCTAPEGYAEDATDLFAQFNTLCGYGLCKTNCDVDVKNFDIDMKGCSVNNVPGLKEQLGNYPIGPVVDAPDLGLDDILGDALQNPLALATTQTCQLFTLAELYNEGDVPFCNTCEVTYLSEDGDGNTPYNVNIDCPNFPEEEDDTLVESFAGFKDLCSYDICQSCDVDSEVFKVDLKNCSFSSLADGLLDGIFDYLTTNVTGDFDFFNPDPSKASSVQGFFDSYFFYLCDSKDNACGSCGSKPTDESVFSFEFNCPAKVEKQSAFDVNFGYQMYFASAFCERPENFGLKCSTCDADFWDFTVDIGNCVILTEAELAEAGAPVQGYSDENTFSYLYSEICGDKVSAGSLQDLIERPDCSCTVDKATKTASISCAHEQNCYQFSSYCAEPFEFCDSYETNIFIEKDSKLSFQRCATLSSGSPNYDSFNYCVDIFMANGVVDGIASKFPGCEMEVDGVRCNSCYIMNAAEISLLEFESSDSNIFYNCNNTVIGSNGKGNLFESQLFDDTFQYFMYKTLPCSGGCDLCGVGDVASGENAPKTTFMTNPDGVFATEKWKDNVQDRCFDAQLDAMSLKEPLTNEECQYMRDVVREPCGCKNPNPPQSSAKSIGSPFSTMSSILLTIAAASIIQGFMC